MTEKEWNRKTRRWLGLSVGSYFLAYSYGAVCYMLKAPEDVATCGFVLFTLIGAASALAYGRLPMPDMSPESMEELEKMINEIRENCEEQEAEPLQMD